MRILIIDFRFICSLLSILFSTFTRPSVSISICNTISNKDSRHCVSIFTEAKPFQEAQSECQKIGANLVTLVLTQDVEDIFNALRPMKNSTFWIGLHDMTVSHSFQWISGYPALPKAYWNGAFNQNSDKLCVTMNTLGKPLTSWEMENCSRSLPFICGPTPNITNDQMMPINGACPDGFDRVLNRCFKFYGGFNSTLLTWNAARNVCRTLHEKADLASVLSMDEQNFMTAYMSKMLHNVWIGLHLINNERIWVTGSNVTFTNWKPGEPNNGDVRSCTVMYSRLVNLGQWNDEKCDKASGYVCEAPLQSISPSPYSLRSSIFQQGSCSKGFVQFENNCYQMLSTATALTLEDAWTKCSQLDVNKQTFLFTPHTQGENAIVRAFLSEERFLQARNNRSVTWIGTKWTVKDTGMKWNHSDQSNLNDADLFGNFVKFRFGVQRDVEYCFIASSQLDYIKMVNCSTKIFTQPLCAYKLPSHPESTNISNLVCPTFGSRKWKSYGSNCYAVSMQSMSFEAAEAWCQQLTSNNNSHLVSIHSTEEMNFVKTILTQPKEFWIGLKVHDTAPSNDRVGYSFTWTDNSAFQYYAFRAGEPSLKSNTGADEECVVIRAKTFEWNDATCSTKNAFICKTKAVEAPATTIAPTPSVSPNPTPSTPCDDGHYIINMGCLKVMARKVDWYTAESDCAHWNKDAHLLNFHSHQEMKDFSSFIRKEHILQEEILWLGASWREFSIAPTHWSDGSGMNYVGAYVREQHTPLNSQLCLGLDLSHHSSKNSHIIYSPWRAMNCFNNYNYICLKRDNIPKESPSDSVPPSGTLSCPSGFALYENTCFKLVDKPMYFHEAKKECSQLSGGELAFPSSWAENVFLSSLGGSTSRYAVWIGAQIDPTYNVFQLTSSHAKNFSYFIPPIIWPYSSEEEVNLFENESAVKGIALINNNNPFEQGRWIVQSIYKKYPFICRVPATSSNSQVHDAHDVASSFCKGPLETLYNGTCYSLHVSSSSRDYKTARENCNQLNPKGSLLYLTSSFEEHFVVSWLMKIVNSTKPLHPQLSSGSFSVWLDTQLPVDNINTTEWFWNNGDPILFTHFPLKESQFNSATPAHCMVLDVDRDVAFHMVPGVSCTPSSVSSKYVATVCKRSSVSHDDSAGGMQPVQGLSKDCVNWNTLFQQLLPSQDLYQVVSVQKFALTGYQNLSIRHSQSGKPCWRWDLLPGANKFSNDMTSSVHGHYPLSVKYGSRGYRSYLSNRCSMFEEISHPFTKVKVHYMSYGCFISTTEWEACDVVACSFKTESSFVLSLIVLFILFLSFTIIGGIIFSRYRHKLCFRYTPLHRYPMGGQPMFSSLHESADNNQHDTNDFNGTAFYNPTYQPFA